MRLARGSPGPAVWLGKRRPNQPARGARRRLACCLLTAASERVLPFHRQGRGGTRPPVRTSMGTRSRSGKPHSRRLILAAPARGCRGRAGGGCPPASPSTGCHSPRLVILTRHQFVWLISARFSPPSRTLIAIIRLYHLDHCTIVVCSRSLASPEPRNKALRC